MQKHLKIRTLKRTRVINVKKKKKTYKKLALHLSQSWIISCMRKADKNGDNMMTLKEVKSFLRQINIEVDDMYASMLFEV